MAKRAKIPFRYPYDLGSGYLNMCSFFGVDNSKSLLYAFFDPPKKKTFIMVDLVDVDSGPHNI